MPNWCFNHILITGPASEIQRFVKVNRSKPVRWANLHGAADEITDEDENLYFGFNGLVPVPADIIARGYCRFSIDKAYDGCAWAKEHWGCKWDVCEDKITPEKMGYFPGCTRLEFDFETANKEPSGWFTAVMQNFPALDVQMDSIEPMVSYGRTMYAHGGCGNVEIWTAEQVYTAYYGEEDTGDEGSAKASF